MRESAGIYYQFVSSRLEFDYATWGGQRSRSSAACVVGRLAAELRWSTTHPRRSGLDAAGQPRSTQSTNESCFKCDGMQLAVTPKDAVSIHRLSCPRFVLCPEARRGGSRRQWPHFRWTKRTEKEESQLTYVRPVSRNVGFPMWLMVQRRLPRRMCGGGSTRLLALDFPLHACHSVLPGRGGQSLLP